MSVDTLLAAKLVSIKYMLDKTTVNQLSMWTSGTLPEPAVTKVHDGGTSWTASQLLQMDLPPELKCEENGLLTRNSEILLFNGNKT